MADKKELNDEQLKTVVGGDETQTGVTEIFIKTRDQVLDAVENMVVHASPQLGDEPFSANPIDPSDLNQQIGPPPTPSMPTSTPPSPMPEPYPNWPS